jgi:RNA polymerase sigma factor (sigma-70 family)
MIARNRIQKRMEGIRASREYLGKLTSDLGGFGRMSRASGQLLGRMVEILEHGAMGAWSDGQLLDWFATSGDAKEAALKVLIERHGPMVLGICRRALQDPHDVEDAFQSTFLVLVRKANGLRDRNLVGHWLYGVACRVAAKTRAEGRRQTLPRLAAEPEAPELGTDSEQIDRLAALDEEIGRLPEKFRVPVVLCHLQRLPHHEVANRLGCPVGTIESRLSRARDRLRDRLTRRGLAPALALLAVSSRSTSAAVPQSLVAGTIRSVSLASATTAVAGASSVLALAASAPFWFGSAVIGVGIAVLCGLAFSSASLPRNTTKGEGRSPAPNAADGLRASSDSTDIPSSAAGSGAAGGESHRTTETSPIIAPGRDPSAIAVPLRGITVDGNLDDWPLNLKRHELRHAVYQGPSAVAGQLVDVKPGPDFEAYFQVGYNADTSLIYVALVVRDDRLTVGFEDSVNTDAAEIYIDGNYSERSIPLPASPWVPSTPSLDEWRFPLDAATMPALQYVGIPGSGRGPYGWGHSNPALLFAREPDSTVRMKSRRVGDITTYEWAFRAYDHYPDRPTELRPGKRLGLDVVAVDKDTPEKPAVWVCWGPPIRRFKPCTAGDLGELIIGANP